MVFSCFFMVPFMFHSQFGLVQPFQVDHTIEVNVCSHFQTFDCLQLVKPSLLSIMINQRSRSRSRSPPLVSHQRGDNKAWSNFSVTISVVTPTYVSVVSHQLGFINYTTRALAATPVPPVPPVPPVRPAAVLPAAVPPISEAHADAGAEADAGAAAEPHAEPDATDANALTDGVTT